MGIQVTAFQDLPGRAIDIRKGLVAPRYDPKQCEWPGYTDSTIAKLLPLKHYALYTVWVQNVETGTVDGERFVYALDFIRFMEGLKNSCS